MYLIQRLLTLFLIVAISGTASGAVSLSTEGRIATTADASIPIPAGPLFLNVKDYGVLGDGVTDDMPAIVALFASSRLANGGHVHFPAGTYLVWRASGALANIVSNNITISGDGAATKFVGRDETGVIPDNRGSESSNIFYINSKSHLVIMDVAWEGYLTLLRCISCTDVTVENVRGNGILANAGKWMLQFGIFFGFALDVKVVNSSFLNMNDAVYLSGTAEVPTERAIIQNNLFEHNLPAGDYQTLFPVGVYVYMARSPLIAQNSFRNIYSSLDSGTVETGMGYGIYDGDGFSVGAIIKDNTFEYTGNGAKNAIAIRFNSDTQIVVDGNQVRSVSGHLVCAFYMATEADSASRVIVNNVITLTKDGTDAAGFDVAMRITNSTVPSDAFSTLWTVRNNLISGPWENAIKVTAEALAFIDISDNEIIGGTLAQMMFDGSTASLQRLRISGNRLLKGQSWGIKFFDRTVRVVIENNFILNGNLAGASGNDGMAIFFAGGSQGSVIRDNTVGNTVTGGGLFTGFVANETAMVDRLLKDIFSGNSLMGLNLEAAAWVNFPTASPTTGFYDIDFGDIIKNSAIAAGGVPGWVCTVATMTALTADASNASTTVTVADTTGYATGDLILLSKTANPYSTDHNVLTTWHATTIASVTNGTDFVVTDAIPVGDGTYVSGTGMVKRALFKPFAVIGS